MSRPNTRVLSHSQITELLSLELAYDAVHDVMKAHGQARVISPNLLHADVPRGEFHIKTGGLLTGPDGGVFGLKANGGFFENHTLGLPNIVGIIYLADARTGCPLAVLDSVEISRVRTAAASAVAAKHLARANSECLAVVGTGTQARAQIEALRQVLPLRRVQLVGRDLQRTRERASQFEADLEIEVEAYATVSSALQQADVLVTCTPAQAPLVTLEDVPPGLFIAAVGADSPGKQELAPELVAKCTSVADIHAQCVHVGELQHPIGAGLMTEQDVHAEIGQILCGDKPGRTREDELIVYDSTGTALQDVALGCRVYEAALAQDVGMGFQLGD